MVPRGYLPIPSLGTLYVIVELLTSSEQPVMKTLLTFILISHASWCAHRFAGLSADKCSSVEKRIQ